MLFQLLVFMQYWRKGCVIPKRLNIEEGDETLSQHKGVCVVILGALLSNIMGLHAILSIRGFRGRWVWYNDWEWKQRDTDASSQRTHRNGKYVEHVNQTNSISTVYFGRD